MVPPGTIRPGARRRTGGSLRPTAPNDVTADAPTVIVTGGRAPAALDWVRAFGRAGWRAVVAESEARPLAAASRYCAGTVSVPPPRQAPRAFVGALADLARGTGAALVLPTCEEVFTVAWGREALEAAGARVVAPAFETLRTLHHKGDFAALAARLGLPVPRTAVAASPEALAGAVAALRARGLGVVLKPAFSRFGADVIRDARPSDARRTDVRAARPWLAQERVEGRAVCSFAVAHRGRLTAHAAYHTPLTAGAGAGVAFEPLRSAAAEAFAARVAAATGASGQLAFDFQERPSGELVAVECNPRATSGVHLFGPRDALVGALLGDVEAVVRPGCDAPVALRLGLALAGWRPGRTAAWRAWLGARDAVADPDDPAPARRQVEAAVRLVARAARRGVSPLRASTWDIEWNGGALGPPPR